MLSPWKIWLLRGAGLLTLTLGVVGIVVPLLPTTPFLLLSAACFARSSDRLYHWLMAHRWFGPTIRNYRLHGAVSLRAKVLALALLWGTIGYAAIAVASQWWLRGLLVAIALGVTAHLLHLKTRRG